MTKLDSYFQEDRNTIVALQANNNAVNSCIDYMANNSTEQSPTIIQSYFQAHNIIKDTVNKISRFCKIMKIKIQSHEHCINKSSIANLAAKQIKLNKS